MNSPFFSIIVPVYNVKRYLENSVKSILSQTFDDFECILIDDGSTDGSGQICDTFIQKDNRIKVIHKKNEGVAVARNTGIAVAKGEYILFVDSDDTLSDIILEKSYKKIMEGSSDIVVFGYQRISDNGEVLKKSLPTAEHTLNLMHSKNSDLTFLLWNKVYKRVLFENVNLDLVAGITFSEDSYLTLALQKQTTKISFLSDIGYNYLCRSESVTQKMTIKNHIDRLKAVNLMDSLYDSEIEKPAVLKEIKFDTKFFYIDPRIHYARKTYFQNCKLWRKTFKESNSTYTKEVGTKKMYLYIKLIQFHLDFFAYIFYMQKQRGI